jgi:signal transduction histidine kinase
MTALRERLPRWTTPVDLALAIIFVVVAVTQTLGNSDAPHPVVRATLASLAVSGIAVRRTFPATAAALFGAAMATEALTTESPDESGVLFGCLILAYSVGAYAPRREAFLGAGLMAMAVAVTIGVDPSDSVGNILPSLVLFIALPFALGLAMRRRTQAIAALTLETETLAREADAAVDAERRRIARELHDVVSHAVTVIAVQAEAGQAVIDSDPERARRSLASIGQVSREALDELTRLLAVLRDDHEPGRPESGLTALPSLVEGARAAGLTVGVRDGRDGRKLDPAVDRCAYRVIQEGLTNALRHTGEARVDILLERSPDLLVTTVSSVGKRHTSAYGGTGHGLTGLRERVAGLGGTFESGSPADGRFEIRASLPLARGTSG